LEYGHKVVLPWEISTGSRRISLQDDLTVDEYSDLMKDELEDLVSHRLRALINVEANKARVATWYDKKVKIKEFAQRELVWKLILLMGTKD
jgi:hypothetical protein